MKPDGVVSGQPLVYSKRLARLDHRLLADDAAPAHLFGAAGRIGDVPVTRQQLHGRLAFIGDDDAVRPEIAVLLGR